MHTPVYKHKNLTNSLPELEVVCESGGHCFVAWLNSVKLCFTKHNLLTMWWELIVKLTHPHSENWISQRSKLDFCAPPHLWGHATTQLSLSMTSVLFIIHLLPALFLPSIPHATSTLRSLSFGPRVLAAKGGTKGIYNSKSFKYVLKNEIKLVIL